MSMFNYMVEKLRNGVLTFINAIINANRDLPFHDYYHGDENSADLSYIVGDNSLGANGDQKKRFTSKSTLVMCTENTTIRFNSQNNVAITILADTYYEFKSNIYALYHAAITQGEDFYAWFEGTMTNEARPPH